jgi:Zinc finger, C2H2 type.
MADFNQIFMKKTPELQIMSHSKEIPGAYFCHDCGRIYKWRTSMLKHQRLECGKEPQFQCPYCPKRSKQKGNLQQHIKTRHGVDS